MAAVTAINPVPTASTIFEFNHTDAFDRFTQAVNYSTCHLPPRTVKDTLLAQVTLAICYCCVFVLSLCGNTLVIYVVISNRNMQTVTNLFITNLAISDVVVSLSSLWITPMYMYLSRWVWGGPACYLFTLLQGGSIFISTFTLTAIAIDRYQAVLKPFKSRLKIHVSLAVIVSIWVAALMLVAPLVFNTIHAKSCGRYGCFENWSMREMRRVYGFIVLGLQYGIPFTIIFVCYARLSCRLQTRSLSLAGSRSLNRHQAELKRKQRLNKMLMMMVVIFALCWLPINALNLARDAKKEIAFTSYFPLLFLLGHLFGMSATCWNPILYAWMNDNFCREFKAVLPCFHNSTRVTQLNFRGTIVRRGLARPRVKLKQTSSSPCSLQVQASKTSDAIRPSTQITLDRNLGSRRGSNRRHTVPDEEMDDNTTVLCNDHEDMEPIHLGNGQSIFFFDGEETNV